VCRFQPWLQMHASSAVEGQRDRQDWAPQGRGTGWAVWDGAVATAKHLEQGAAALKPLIAPPTVLELGSGTGLAGLAAAAALGLPTLLTDLPQVLPSLQRNVAANPSLAPLLAVAACDWTDPAAGAQLGGPFGLVIASDCVWVAELVAPLVATLVAVVGPTTRVLMAHQSRSARVDALLWGQLHARFDRVPAAPLPGEPARGALQLFWLTPRAPTQAPA